ncbi:17633_t:CDS:2 [Gigaspora margarita]|uniref:17633_t:CDS:1 n=1 Tax=Gigaspora margarita TaxID=4874 RepID=A0ABM8VXE0_GIGMA|nr:17633_t:CDS:2 [Gigaspora margarita]
MPCLPAGRNKLQKLTFRLNKNPSFKGDSEPSPFTDYNSATKKMTLEGKILEREDKDYFFSSVPDINTVILVTNNEKDIKLKLSEKIEEIFNSERKVVVIDGIKKEDISFSGQDHSYHILTLNMGGENSSAFLEEIKSEESKPETLPETLGDLGEDLPESPLILPILLIAVVFIPLFVVFSKNKKNPNKLIINDINSELITTYQIIKKQPKELLKLLKDKGEFNVPRGQKEKVKLFDKENISAISEFLNKNDCQILNQDYQQILPLIKENDFLFVDPPYDGDSGNGFNSYTTDRFIRENQKELAQFLKKSQRFINCQGDKRMEGAQEIFIGNYQLTEQQKKIFDGGGVNFRKSLLPQYKAQRESMPEELREQMEILKELFTKIKITYLQLVDCEADDVIASFVTQNAHKPELTFDIFTRDKDLLQLINQNTNILKYIKEKLTLYTQQNFHQEYNFFPSNYVDYLSLLGDNVDNIEGVRGIGPVNAKKLIQQFHTVENIYQASDALPDNVKNLLIDKQELVFCNKKIIGLENKLTLPLLTCDFN